MELSSLDVFRTIFLRDAAMFKKNFEYVQTEFGEHWASEFDIHLERLFGKDKAAYENAVKGYTSFAIDAMRLQRLFNKKLKYEEVSYEEACEKVYLNESYMMNLYLPGISVSHFLWRHHYKQFLYFKENYLPLMKDGNDQRFYDVGTGTGFFSIQVMRHYNNFKAYGIDTSPYSRKFTSKNIAGWGFEKSFEAIDVDINSAELDPLPYIHCVEVIEHLANPQLFLNNLRRLLKVGGYGFITTALTAPNADHIYLYWTPQEVIDQLEIAGFRVRDYVEEAAYEGKPGEHVPKVVAFIVS